MTESLIALFERDIDRVIIELSLYRDELNIWKVENQIANSAGNLALHLIGNLNTYIGKEIGKINYQRDRELEFSQKNVARADIIEKLYQTKLNVNNALKTLKNEDYKKEYPILVFAEKTSSEYFLIHLATHVAYHLGQINYHRRLID